MTSDTAKLSAEAANIKRLVQSGLSYAGLAKRVPTANVVAINADGVVLFCNWPDVKYPSHTLIGTNFFHLVGAGCKDEFRDALGKAMKLGNATLDRLVIAPGGTPGNWSAVLEAVQRPGEAKHAVVVTVPAAAPIVEDDSTDPVVDAADIRTLILNSILAQDEVELLLDDSNTVFTSFFLEHSPKGDDETRSTDPDRYKPGYYLKTMNYVLVSPVEPSFGNIQLRKATRILLRFHNGIRSFAGVVEFKRVIQNEGNFAIKLSYPISLEKSTLRRSDRIKIPFGMVLKVRVSRPDGETFDAMAADISSDGMSFYYPPQISGFENGEELNMIITEARGEGLKISGTVCHSIKLRSRDTDESGATSRARCGVEFYSLDPSVENKFKGLLERMKTRFQQQLEMKRQRYAITW